MRICFTVDKKKIILQWKFFLQLTNFFAVDKPKPEEEGLVGTSHH